MNVNDPEPILDMIDRHLASKTLLLTKREYFAAMAMQGLISCAEYLVQAKTSINIATNAAELADALIARLNKTEREET